MLWIQHFELNIIKYSFYYIWRLWFWIILLNICCINMKTSRQIRVWYHEFICVLKLFSSNFLNKFDVELSFLNDLRFNLISNLFLDLDSLFRNLFKLQLSMLSIYIFEFVVSMHILHNTRKLWFLVVYQLFICDCIIKKKRMKERPIYCFKSVFYLFFQHNQCYVHYGFTVYCLRWM